MLGHVHQRAAIDRAGAQFVDLFGPHSIEDVDSTTHPVPCRHVTFAATHAESVADDVAALEPDLIVYETFAVIAPVVARLLGLPYVNVATNQVCVPSVVPEMYLDPRLNLSDACTAAVERLRDVHGMPNASPFLWLDGASPWLNLYCEPEAFLPSSKRAELAPCEFVGCLAPELRAPVGESLFPDRDGRTRVYVSFGTYVWVYFGSQVLAALTVIAEASPALDVDVVITLGGFPIPDDERRRLTGCDCVTVVEFADQWSALEEADIFITHHGVNSTHEAIYQEVPMLSYPFLGDQPLVAARCQELGLAVPLTSATLEAIEPSAVARAIGRVLDDASGFADRLAHARGWEEHTIAARPAIVERIATMVRTDRWT